MTTTRVAYYPYYAAVPKEMTTRLDALTDGRVLAEGPNGSVAIGREGKAWIAAVVYASGATDILRVVTVQPEGPTLTDLAVALQVMASPLDA